MTAQPAYNHHSDRPIIRIAPQFQEPAFARLRDALVDQIADCKVVEISDGTNADEVLLTVLAWNKRHERTMKVEQSIAVEFLADLPDDMPNCGIKFIVDSIVQAFSWLDEVGPPGELLEEEQA